MKKIVYIILFYIGFISLVTAQIRIVTGDEPPTNYLENVMLVGTSVDILNEMIKASGENIKIEYLPWKRAVEISYNNPNIIIFTCGKTQKRINHGFHFIGPIITRKHALITLSKSKIKIRRIEDLKKYSIAGLNGDWRSQYLIDQGIPVEITSSNQANYKKLINGRVDLIISSDIESFSLTQLVGIKQDDIQVVWVIKEAPSFIMISKDTGGDEVKRWTEIFKKVVKSGVLNKHAKKWSIKLKTKIIFNPQKGFILDK